MSGVPVELSRLRERMAEIADLGAVFGLMFWDQNTMMPPRGAPARGDQLATLTRVMHARTTHPEIGRLLDALEPWAAGQDPDGIDARTIRWVRHDFEKSVRVPAELAADLSRAKALGQQAWEEARAADDFGRFRDALARHIELRHRYVACFDGFAHPYDALLDDFEPGLTTAELRPLLARLRDALVPLVAATGDPDQRRNDGVFAGPWEVDVQRAAVTRIAEAVGFDPDAWRLDPSLHPFASSLSTSDIRLTTKYDINDFGMTLYSVLHEFGHGLYEAQLDPALYRTTLGEPVSLGVHESQSRLWENNVGRSRPFCRWLHGQLSELLPGGLGAADADALFRAVNSVQPSLIRIEADETTYNLHIILRFELELALMEGSLAVDDAPAAWNAGTERLLGLEVPTAAEGILQDVHWSAGLIGYFPTYTIGNLMSAQLWARLRADLPGLDEGLERGDFGPLREWLREHVHRHGRIFEPRELLRRVTGEELQVEPLVDYLRGRLEDAGLLAPGAVG
ncbi:MAG: carboxypeptidase Taq [Solirubrobacteraceae bacterium]|nr:carboxypeptidase Taq [Solirubrobacteraceae bacterium]